MPLIRPCGPNGCPPLIDEEITRRVTKHMRMGIDIQAGSQPRARCRPKCQWGLGNGAKPLR